MAVAPWGLVKSFYRFNELSSLTGGPSGLSNIRLFLSEEPHEGSFSLRVGDGVPDSDFSLTSSIPNSGACGPYTERAGG